MNNWANEIVDKYYDFLKKKTVVVTDTQTEWDMIATPFLGLFNDAVIIFIKKDEDKVILSDDSTILRELEHVGIKISNSYKIKNLLNEILLHHNVQLAGTELIVKTDETNVARSLHNFILAILKIYDIHILR